MKLKDKVAIISGGGTGIGAATAALFRKEGAQVVIMGRRRAPLDEVAQATGSLAFVGDAGVTEDARAAVAFAKEKFGGVDILVPNAGVAARGGVKDLSNEDWLAALHANLATAYTLCREGLPAVIDRRGTIVVVSSLAGHFAPPELASYSTSKHALTGLTKSMARDYGPLGVRVNCVSPGWVRTPMADQSMAAIGKMMGTDQEGAYKIATKNVPIRRPGTSEEIANIILFLACEDSAVITGTVVMADGGAHVVDLPTIDLGPDSH